jgi:hypothetical protein
VNERIGKLAVEAGAHWEHSDWNMPSAVYFSERDLVKFAELIVIKCAEIADTAEPFLASDLIKQHFGVEE